MSWAALFAMILKFLEQLPALVELIRSLFDNAKPTGTVDGLDPPVAISNAFAAARAQTWWWQLGKRGALAAAERVCMRRAAQLVTAARANTAPPWMTAGELAALRAAL